MRFPSTETHKQKGKKKQMKTIKIEVYGGCVTEVSGLPEGYDYEIVDHDHLKETYAGVEVTGLPKGYDYEIVKEKGEKQ